MISFNKKYKKYIFASIVITLVFSFGIVNPKPVNAAGGMSVDPLELLRDIPLKSIAWRAKQMVIAKITDDTVNWINSGFEGDPAFIENPQYFFADVANEVTGQFIDELGAGFLCQPFSLQIQIAIATPYYYRSQCTVLDVIDNYDAFLDDFSQGGWAGWISITQNPQNNPYGAYLLARDELNRRITEKKQNVKDDVSQGGGFLSLKTCVEWYQETPEADGCDNAEAGFECDRVCTRYEKQTPGQTLSAQLNKTISSSVSQLEVSDQISESMIAIAGALVNQMFQKGLRGLTDSSSGAPRGTWYEDAIGTDKQDLIKSIKEDLAKLDARGLKSGETDGKILDIINCYDAQLAKIRDINFKPPNINAVPTISDLQKKLDKIGEKQDLATKIKKEMLIQDNTPQIGRWFRWGTKNTVLNKKTDVVIQTIASSFSVGLYNLIENTTYYFSAVIRKNNNIFYGDIYNFTTSSSSTTTIASLQTVPIISSETPAPEFIRTKEATEITPISIRLNGWASSGEGLNRADFLKNLLKKLEQNEPPLSLREFSDIWEEYRQFRKKKDSRDATSVYTVEEIKTERDKLDKELLQCDKDLKVLDGWIVVPEVAPENNTTQ